MIQSRQVLALVDARKVALHQLEKELKDTVRAVNIRRAHLTRALVSDNVVSEGENAIAQLPSAAVNERDFYSSIEGTNCEAVIGFVA